MTHVKGISYPIAISIAPSIDWSIPETSIKPPKFKITDFIIIILISASVTGIVYWITAIRYFPELQNSINEVRTGQATGVVNLWKSCSFIIMQGSLLLAAIPIVIHFYYIEEYHFKVGWLKKIIQIPLFLFLFSLLSAAAARATYHQLFTGWGVIFNNPVEWLAILVFLFLLIVVSPLFLALWMPKLFRSPVIKMYDIAILLAGPLLAAVSFYYRSYLTIFVAIPLAVMGLSIIVISINSFRECLIIHHKGLY